MKGVWIAADVESDIQLDLLVRETYQIPEVLGYKLGLSLVIQYGLKYCAGVILQHTDKEVCYDHQKAGTDIPEMGIPFASSVRRSGADSVILFPLAGPDTAEHWINACQDQGLKIIVGGLMTHKEFTTQDGGLIDAARLFDIFDVALWSGVNNFVIPGSPQRYRAAKVLANYIRRRSEKPVQFYAPGIGSQGGSLKDLTEAVGGDIIPIVGRSIYNSPDIAKATNELIAEIT